jgi:transcriptional regulator with XRE-family HTH domain
VKDGKQIAYCINSVYRNFAGSTCGLGVMDFPERLKALRSEKKATQAMLAQITGLTDRTFRKYEAGAIEPTMSVLIALADYFDVSIDYLVGRSDDPARR